MMDARAALAAAAATVLVAFARRRRWLTPGGAVAALAVTLVTLVTAGWRLVALLAYLLVSVSTLTRVRPARRAQQDGCGGRRGRQVAAVMLVPVTASVLAALGARPAWLGAALAAIATTAADTWAVEIGRLAPRAPVMITTGVPVAAGRSGGVTALGFVGALVGALTTALAARGLGLTSAGAAPALATIGFGGAIVDSLIGALAQAEYRCDVCGRVTEVPAVCHGRPGRLAKGWRALDNEVVNLVTTAWSATAYLAWAALRG